GQPDVVDNGGPVIHGQLPADGNYRFASAQLEHPGDFGRCAQASAFQDAAFGASALAFVVGGQAQEPVAHARLVVGGDEGSLALPAQQQVLGGQFIDRLADRALAYLEAGCQVDFAGDEFAGLPFAAFQALHQQVFG